MKDIKDLLLFKYGGSKILSIAAWLMIVAVLYTTYHIFIT